MARDKQAREHRRETSNLDRRGYLKAAGTALVGAIGGAGVTATTARAANPVSANWEVRNRYIETGSNQLGIGCAVTDPDGEGVIEHVYVRSTGSSDKPAIWVDPNRHVGHLVIRNVHVEGHADNAIYAETAPPHGAGGTVTIEDCYLHDNTRGNLRINGGTEVRNTHVHNTGENFPTRGYASVGYYSFYAGKGEITMRHCQIDVDGSHVRNGSGALALMTKGSTSAYGDYGSNIPTVSVHDSQVKGEIDGHDGNIRLHDSGSNPTIDPPNGVPMSPEEAESGTSSATGPTWADVSGGGSSGSDSGSKSDSGADSGSESGSTSEGGDLPNALVIDGTSAPNAVCTYRFSVSGSAAKSDARGSINAYDEVSGDEITGRVVGGKDAYRFSGEITGFTVDGPAAVRLDSQS